jgi:hypothetical protein
MVVGPGGHVGASARVGGAAGVTPQGVGRCPLRALSRGDPQVTPSALDPLRADRARRHRVGVGRQLDTRNERQRPDSGARSCWTTGWTTPTRRVASQSTLRAGASRAATAATDRCGFRRSRRTSAERWSCGFGTRAIRARTGLPPPASNPTTTPRSRRRPTRAHFADDGLFDHRVVDNGPHDRHDARQSDNIDDDTSTSAPAYRTHPDTVIVLAARTARPRLPCRNARRASL